MQGPAAASPCCSEPLFTILLQSQYGFQQSKGRFDIPWARLPVFGAKPRKEKAFPEATLVKEKLALTGFNKLILDTVQHTAVLQQAGMQLDLGGIGQGYIAQHVINYLRTCQVDNALVDVSGDIVCSGSPPGKPGWSVAINVPESEEDLLPRQLLITQQAVTTSAMCTNTWNTMANGIRILLIPPPVMVLLHNVT